MSCTLTTDTTVVAADLVNLFGDNAAFLTKVTILDPSTSDPAILIYYTFSQFPGEDIGWFQPFDHIGSYCNGACTDPATTLTISAAAAPEPGTYALIGLGLVAVALKRKKVPSQR